MLTTSNRPCPHGHGDMARQPGIFGLTELGPTANKLASAGGIRVMPTGRYFAVGVFLCDACGHIELVDMEAP